MSENIQAGRGRQLLGDVAPTFAALTDDVLFANVWNRPELSPRDRSLITIAALVTGGNSQQLAFHLQRGLQNGLTEAEMIEALTHLAFYAGWPKAMSAITTATDVLSL